MAYVENRGPVARLVLSGGYERQIDNPGGLIPAAIEDHEAGDPDVS